ncbi:MAG TPA: adenylosuccinate lyase, partial [Phycisphaerae bacterium]|nr:adenylosuccinate lyase [Phycisphaerae bacterium]
ENIIMAGVKAGGDRQVLHEVIRKHSMDAGKQVKMYGKPNDLIDRLKADSACADIDIDSLLDPITFVGRAPQQVDEFLDEVVTPILRQYDKLIMKTPDLSL